MNDTKQQAIKKCLEARQKAILIKSSSCKVGAAIYSPYAVVSGYNIQNKCHKSYHAEEMACLRWLQSELDLDLACGIIVSFSAKDIKQLTFACGHCRQTLWETFKNLNMLVTEVDLEGNIVKEVTLGELYPYPYPR